MNQASHFLTAIDAGLFELIKEKRYISVVANIHDAPGYGHQFLSQPIQPFAKAGKENGAL